MLKRWMHKREHYLAMLNDNRLVRPFEWGTEFIGEEEDHPEPFEVFRKHSKRTIETSDDYFGLPQNLVFEHNSTGRATALDNEKAEEDSQLIEWQSPITTPSAENNRARGRIFRHENDKKAAVVVLPHWNAQAGSYFNLCENFQRFGVSAFRLTMPYHEERMPPELERADHLVSPNVGRTLESIRQAVLDTRAAVKWLYEDGYKNVGVVGTSIGSCVAFLAFAHDQTIKSAVFNHVSGYPADVVWRGLSTYHVRQGLESGIDLDALRECWLPISPMTYMDKLVGADQRPQHYIYTLYDLSFPVDLSRDTIRALKQNRIEHSKTAIPCGHYTLGEKPWVYLDGYKIISFLRKHLR